MTSRLGQKLARIPLRRLAEVIDCAHVTAEFVDEDCRFPVASIRECAGPSVDLSNCKYTTEKFFQLLRASGRTPRPGDLLFVRNVSVGLVSAVTSDLPEFAVGQETVLIRRTADTEPRFLRYALISSEVGFQIERHMIGSTFRRINVAAVRSLLVPDCSSDDQRAIADYLDRETARIDTLIGEQQQLAEMLRERRQTQIDWVVWRGLDDSAVSPNPIEPAPDTPAHWRMLRNKNLLVESTTVSADGSEELLSVSHLTGITPRSEKNVTMTEAENLDGYRVVEPGDLVINTMWAWMGALGVSRNSGIVSPAYGVYRPLRGAEFHPPYFDYLYRSRAYVVEMTRFSRGIWSSRLRIYPEVFLRLHVAVPPLDEQRRIAAYLDEQNARIDTLIAETERFIELSRERRSALITAAVTGQVDVRGEVA